MRLFAFSPIIVWIVLGILFAGTAPAHSADAHRQKVERAGGPAVYEVVVDVVDVQPLVVREQIFQPERVCRERSSSRSSYRGRQRGYHNPNHPGHYDNCPSDLSNNAYRCYTIERERSIERIDGYQVTYLYNGQQLSKRLSYDPGSKLRIQVHARPQVSRLNLSHPSLTL